MLDYLFHHRLRLIFLGLMLVLLGYMFTAEDSLHSAIRLLTWKPQEAWRDDMEEPPPGSISLGYRARGAESDRFIFNLETGAWHGSSVWIMWRGPYGTDGVGSIDLNLLPGIPEHPPNQLLTPTQRLKIKECVENLPPSDPIWPDDKIRMKVRVKVKGYEGVYFYRYEKMCQVVTALSKITQMFANFEEQ